MCSYHSNSRFHFSYLNVLLFSFYITEQHLHRALFLRLKAPFTQSSSHFCFTVNRFLHHNQIQFNTPLHDLLMKELRGETSLSWAGTQLHNWIVRPAFGGFIHFRERLSKGALLWVWKCQLRRGEFSYLTCFTEGKVQVTFLWECIFLLCVLFT